MLEISRRVKSASTLIFRPFMGSISTLYGFYFRFFVKWQTLIFDILPTSVVKIKPCINPPCSTLVNKLFCITIYQSKIVVNVKWNKIKKKWELGLKNYTKNLQTAWIKELINYQPHCSYKQAGEGLLDEIWHLKPFEHLAERLGYGKNIWERIKN